VDPAPFIRGAAFPAAGNVAYPRAKPDDRLPRDTWNMASIPAGVRIDIVGLADAVVEITYRTAEDNSGYRPERGKRFETWVENEMVDWAEAVHDTDENRVRIRPGVIYLPEWMKPTVLGVEAVEGEISPAPRGPKWIAYGDSVLEGWVATSPALAWPMVAARDHGLDVVNMGYAGSARGEIVSAEHICELDADVISITHGTNCWTRTPHSAAQMAANTDAFLDVLRRGHPDTPLVVASPIVRPDAEDTPNVLGATLADLRHAMESVVEERIAGGDEQLQLVHGLPIVPVEQLADGIHPNDAGHQALAEVVGPAVAAAALRKR
jgi:lysophospholipase L1-like esterase